MSRSDVLPLRIHDLSFYTYIFDKDETFAVMYHIGIVCVSILPWLALPTTVMLLTMHVVENKCVFDVSTVITDGGGSFFPWAAMLREPSFSQFDPNINSCACLFIPITYYNTIQPSRQKRTKWESLLFHVLSFNFPVNKKQLIIMDEDKKHWPHSLNSFFLFWLFCCVFSVFFYGVASLHMWGHIRNLIYIYP